MTPQRQLDSAGSQPHADDYPAPYQRMWKAFFSAVPHCTTAQTVNGEQETVAPLAQTPVTSKQANGRWITYVYGNYKKSKPKFRAEGTALPIHSIAQTPLRIGGKIKTTKRRGQIHRQGLSRPQSRSLGNPSVSFSLNIFQQFSAKNCAFCCTLLLEPGGIFFHDGGIALLWRK